MTRYVVKVDDEYLAGSLSEEVWTLEQCEALRFREWECAFDCAEAWRYGPNRIDARVVKLVKKARA